MSSSGWDSRSELIHPNPILPLANACAGTIIVILVMASSLMALSVLPIFAQIALAMRSDGGVAYAFFAIAQLFGVKKGASAFDLFRLSSLLVSIPIFVVFYVPFAVRAFWLGFSRIGIALLQFRNSGVPSGIPENLSDQMGVLRKMVQREKYTNGWKTGSITALFGLNVQFLSPLATDMSKAIAERVSRWFGKLFRAIFASVAVGALIFWTFGLPANYSDLLGLLAATLQASGLWPSLIMGLTPLVLLTVLTALTTVLDYSFVAMLVPKRAWPTECLTRGDRVVASTSPNLISLELPLRLENYRSANESNRVYRLTNETAATSVSETGNFIFLGLIEQQPQNIGNPNHRAARLWLIGGWIIAVLGVVVQLFFLIPPALNEAITAHRLPSAVYTLTPMTQLLYVALGVSAFSLGRRMVAEAERLYASYWFASSTLGYQIRGMTSRSEVNIGRGQTDSVQTSSTVYRSEFLHDLTTTTILSEAITLDGQRAAIGMQNSEESQAFLDAGLHELTRIVETRAAPISVDLGHQGLQDQIRANTMIEAMRIEQTEAMRLRVQRDDANRGVAGHGTAPQLPDDPRRRE
ncbi:hypothetical protein PMI42_08251 [Bradyrhizobium sp. YR681]|nr:hypothetical protein PMI42_08251 [Bradyrhizobium sp. YR681]